ncbi:hypothetical protein [Mesorhizobium temperatum]|uniref:hypothetical protein n=1 Tax=Mesorhizobium temperatum TaxID=241416 RepID=UPI00315A0BE7
MVVPNILAAPVTRGLPDAIIQREEIDPIHLDSAFCLLASTGVAITALILDIRRCHRGRVRPTAYGGARKMDQRHRCDPGVWCRTGGSPQAATSTVCRRTLTGSVVGGAWGVGMAIAGFCVGASCGCNSRRPQSKPPFSFLEVPGGHVSGIVTGLQNLNATR